MPGVSFYFLVFIRGPVRENIVALKRLGTTGVEHDRSQSGSVGGVVTVFTPD